MRGRRSRVAALTVMTATVAAVASAATPQGPELVVPVATDFTQEDTAVTIASSGRFAATWQTELAAGAHDDVALRFFNADGTPASGQLDVASGAPDQDDPQIAGNAAGAGVVVYEHTDDPDGAGLGEVRARRFDAAGALGPEFPVNEPTPTATEESVSAAMNASGAFVVAWRTGRSGVGDGEEVRAQRFDAAGAKVGPEIAVNTTTSGNQDHPSVSMDDSGGFVVVWDDSAQDGSGLGVYARTFGADGTPITGETLVNAHTSLDQGDPDVARAPDGDTVVVWNGSGPGDVDTVWGRRLSASGVPQGVTDTPLSSAPTSDDVDPAVAIDAAGRVTTVWSFVEAEDSSPGVMIRGWAPGLTSPTAQERVNVTIPLEQRRPDVAVGAGDRIVVGWSGRGAASTSSDALARRAVAPTPPAPPAPPDPGGPPPAPSTPGTSTPTTPPAGSTPPPAAPSPVPSPTRPTPAGVTASSVIKLPSARKCVSRRRFRIRLVIPKGLAVKSATVSVNGKRVKVVKGSRLRSVVDLRGLPKGRFTVKVVVTPKSGKSLRSQRRYRTCTPRARSR